jgi:TetR/AcrR family transcriptional regulator, transcriptional repressor for nem operon
MQTLSAIRQQPVEPLEQFRQFIAVFGTTAKSGSRVCLGGMLASDLVTLPPDLKDDVQQFFAQVEAWVAELLEDGRRRGSFAFAGSPALLASVIVAALEGGLITARVFADVDRPETIGAQLEALFVAR